MSPTRKLEAWTTRADRSRWTITRYTSLDEMKADEYRFWQGRPGHEKLAIVCGFAREAHGEEVGDEHAQRRQWPFLRAE